MLAANAAKRAEIDSLEGELALIQDPHYVLQQARSYRLGDPHEIPFTLAQGAPPSARMRPARLRCGSGRRPRSARSNAG